LKRAEKEVDFILKHDITPLYYLDEAYPKRLKYCDDGPVMIFCKGKMCLNAEKTIAIVGTRKATEYGRAICKELVGSLAPQDPLIVSGLAYGIDICAHNTAVKNDLQTVAVLGHGLDRIYPVQHKKIVIEMLTNGGVITEFLSHTKPDRENFPQRNRIIAGMSDAILVVESGIKGGSMITASIANSYNRDVFAIPGRVGDPHSAGCNFLIKSNRAVLVENAEEIEKEMNWERKQSLRSIQKSLFTELSEDEKTIMKFIDINGKASIDEIALRTEMTISTVSASLLELEFKGMVRTQPGKLFERT